MNYSYKERMLAEGWINVHDRQPEKPGLYLVEDHNGNRFTSEFAINKFNVPVWIGSKGYDICWWKTK